MNRPTRPNVDAAFTPGETDRESGLLGFIAFSCGSLGFVLGIFAVLAIQEVMSR